MTRILTGINILFFTHFLSAQPLRLVLPQGHVENINKVAFNKNGNLLLSYSADKCLIWKVKTGKVLLDIRQPGSKITNAVFDSLGSHVLTTIDYKGACIFNMSTGETDKCFYVKNATCGDAIYGKNYQSILASFSDSAIYIYNVKSGNIETKIKLPFLCRQMKLNSDGSLLSVVTDSLYFDEIFAEYTHETHTKLINLKTKEIYHSNKMMNDNKKSMAVDDFESAFSFSSKLASKNKELNFDSFKDSCYIYDKHKKRTVFRFESKYNANRVFSYNKSQNLLAITSNNTVSVFDSKKWFFLKELSGRSTKIESIQYNQDLNVLLSIHDKKDMKQWELSKAKLGFAFDDPSYCADVSGAYYCDKNLLVLIEPCDNSITGIWDSRTGKQVNYNSFNFNDDCFLKKADMVKGSKYVRIKQGVVNFYSSKGDSLLFSIIPNTDQILSVTLSPDEKQLIIADPDRLTLWNTDNRTLTKTLYERTTEDAMLGKTLIEKVFFSPKGNYFLVIKTGEEIDLWDSETLQIVYRLGGKSGLFINDTILAVVNNDAIVFHNIKKKTEKFRLIGFNSNDDYMILLPDGYYCGDNNAIKSVHYVKNHDIIGFEQLDVKYNRPDKVLEAMGSRDTALINSYRKAWHKRIKKLGIDTTSFRGSYSIPHSDIENREGFKSEQRNEALTLHIKGTDSIYQLDRFNIWINEIPLFGQKGCSIKERHLYFLDTIITIHLSQGENRIETSVLNLNGAESYRMPLTVNYVQDKRKKENLYFIGIGIDKFADSVHNLQYSAKDIRDLSKNLKEKFGNEIMIDTLFNENVTISNVKALKKKLKNTSVNDKVIVSYSGHGLLSKDYDYYLSTYSVNFEKPEENGLPYDELENLLDSIPARKKLMLIDACHSGEVDKDEVFAMNNSADSMGLTKPKGGLTVNNKSTQQLGLKNSFELMQSLFVNVGKSTGATIISAAAGNQFALEKGDLKNGVFTYCIIEAMNNHPTMTVSQLKTIVGKRVEEITNGLQKPTSRNETINSDWSVW